MVRQYNTDNATRCVQAHPMSAGQISPRSSRFRIPVQNLHSAHVKFLYIILYYIFFPLPSLLVSRLKYMS